MSYPIQKSDEEWQAVLNPGNHNSSMMFTLVLATCYDPAIELEICWC